MVLFLATGELSAQRRFQQAGCRYLSSYPQPDDEATELVSTPNALNQHVYAVRTVSEASSKLKSWMEWRTSRAANVALRVADPVTGTRR